MDERPHYRHPGKHRQVRHDAHPDGAFHGQHHRWPVADHPADLGGTDERRNGGDRSQDQGVRQVHVADGFFFATNFPPFLVGMGKQPHNVMNHADHSSQCCQTPPNMERKRPEALTPMQAVMWPYVAV
ncbi:hypothetical protein D3C75_888880 [compost metagenome]